MTSQTLKTRDQIPPAMTWDLTDLYPDLAAWQADLTEAIGYVSRFAGYVNRLAESPAILLAAMRLDDECQQVLERLECYASRRYHEDTANSANKDLTLQVSNLNDLLGGARAFLVPEILAIEPARLAEMTALEPALNVYHQYFLSTRAAVDHCRNAEVEKVISEFASVIDGAGPVAETLTNTDLPAFFPRVRQTDSSRRKLDESQYEGIVTSTDRAYRRRAWRALIRGYGGISHTSASLYNLEVKAGVAMARTRNYGSAIEMYLDRSNLPLSVYDNLIAAVHDHLPLVQRYLRLKRQHLGLNSLRNYDLSAPLVAAESNCTYADAQAAVLESVALLGDDYVEIVADCYRSRRIDVLPNQGKYRGAYNVGIYGIRPYILLNWTGSRRGRSTLAHETGHYGNEWECNAQPFRNYHYTIFNAEVASTMNELLLTRRDLAAATSGPERIQILQADLDNFMGTIVRQTLFAEFEREAHALVEAGKPLTRDRLCSLHFGLNETYYAPAVHVEKVIENEWARIPHFYSPFYVFSYATALSAAICIFNRMLAKGQPAIAAYRDFLRAGCRDYPLPLLKEGGADLTTKEPVVEAFRYFASNLDRLESELQKA